MSNILKTEKYKGYKIVIIQDEDPINPRENENIGTMYCFHRRYKLGDKHTIDTNKFNSLNEIKDSLDLFVWLPLYLYDHSEITISTKPFNDRFDSGTIGFIGADKDKIKKEYGNLSEETKQKVLNILESEVKTYDQYLRMEILGYQISKEEKCNLDCIHDIHINSCYGFYLEIDELAQEVKYEIDSFPEFN